MNWFKVNEFLSGNIEVSRESCIYIGDEFQIIGEVEVNLEYKCDKLMGRCIYSEFYLFPEVLRDVLEEDINLAIDRRDIKCSEKFRCEASGNLGVKVRVDIGRGKGLLSVVYDLKGKVTKGAKDFAKYKFTVQLYINIPKENQRIKLGSPADFIIEVIKPIDKIDVDISPKVNRYAVGDSVKLNVNVVSKYKGEVVLKTGGAIDSKGLKSSVDSGSNNFSLDGVIRSLNEAKIYLDLPKIGYKEVVSIPLNIVGKRLNVEKIEVDGSPKLGEKARLRINLSNMSLIGETPTKIKVILYGYKIEEEIVINPNEFSEVILETSTILTRDSREKRRGILIVEDRVSGQTFSRDLELPDPLPLNVVFKPKIQTLRLPSCAIRKVEFLYVENKEDKQIRIYLADIKPSPSICSIVMDDVDINPNSNNHIDIEVKPSGTGVEKLELEFKLAIDGIDVDIYRTDIMLDVYESFKVNELTIVSPSNGYAVKKQRVNVKLDIDVLSDSMVRLEVMCKGIELDNKVYHLNPGKNTLNISGITIDYVDGIELEISDGVTKKSVIIPIKVEKPSVKCQYKSIKLFKGLWKSIQLRCTKEFEVPIEINMDINELGNVKVQPKQSKIVINSDEREKDLVLDIMGIDVGKAIVTFEIVSRYLDEKGEEVDRWSNDYIMDLEVLMPIDMNVINKPSVISLPFPFKPVESKLKHVQRDFVVELKNLSDQIVPNVSINVSSNANILASVKPIKGSIDPTKSIEYHVSLLIPVSYSDEELNVTLTALSEGYQLIESTIKIPIERYHYSIVKIPKQKFNEACRYERIYGENSVYVLLPLWETDVEICGKPENHSVELFNIIKTLFNTLSELDEMPMFIDPWSAAASVIFKNIAWTKVDFSKECDFLRNMYKKTMEINISVVPATLWILTLNKLIPGCTDMEIQLPIEQVDKLGLIYTKNNVMNVSLNNLYKELLRFIKGANSDAHNIIKNYIEVGITSPIYLLYLLNGGKELPYKEEIANSIHDKDASSYLIYKVLTNHPIVNDISVLNKINNSIYKIKENKIKPLLMALLLNKIFKNLVIIIR